MSGRSPRTSLDRPALADTEDRQLCYLLFAGSQQPRQGGLADLVGAFSSEAAAREAFRHLRLSHTSASSWAQLAVVDRDHGIRALSWFGIGATPARTPVTSARPEKSIDTHTEGGVMQTATLETPSPADPEVEPNSRRLARTIVVCLVALVALAAITIGVVAGESTPRPVTPNSAIVEGGSPANSSVVPSSVDGSVLTYGTSGFER